MTYLVKFYILIFLLSMSTKVLFAVDSGNLDFSSSKKTFKEPSFTVSKDIEASDKSIKRIDRFDEKRNIIKEEYFLANKLWQTISFSYYEGSGLLKHKKTTEYNQVIEDIEYFYHEDGSVWFTRESEDKFSYYLDTKILNSQGDNVYLINDISGGRINESTLIENGKTTESTVYEYGDNNQIISITSVDNEYKQVEKFNEVGLLNYKAAYRNGVKIEEFKVTYDKEGRIISRSNYRQGDDNERVESTYKKDQLAVEKRYVDNELVQKTVFTSPKIRDVYYYVLGNLVLYEQYENGVKTTEKEY